jgi:hypothetical protein
MYVIKDELNHFEEKFAKNYTDFLIKKIRCGFGDRIRTRPGQKVPDPDPQKKTGAEDYFTVALKRLCCLV